MLKDELYDYELELFEKIGLNLDGLNVYKSLEKFQDELIVEIFLKKQNNKFVDSFRESYKLYRSKNGCTRDSKEYKNAILSYKNEFVDNAFFTGFLMKDKDN